MDEDVLRTLHLLGATKKARIEKYNGRDHIVVPVVALMEGVIHAVNSDIPEFVPADVLKRAAASWNGKPVVLGHPVKNGRQCSANAPDLLEVHGLGTIFNSRWDGKLLQEAWIDQERAEKLHPAMAKRLLEGDSCEVSVGAFVATSDQGGEHNGKRYEGSWRESQGDHLAFLPDGRGACSIEMGCGAHRAAAMRVCGDHMELETLGGPGSGNFGHGGRPGERGGSSTDGGHETASKSHESAALSHDRAYSLQLQSVDNPGKYKDAADRDSDLAIKASGSAKDATKETGATPFSGKAATTYAKRAKEATTPVEKAKAHAEAAKYHRGAAKEHEIASKWTKDRASDPNIAAKPKGTPGRAEQLKRNYEIMHGRRRNAEAHDVTLFSKFKTFLKELSGAEASGELEDPGDEDGQYLGRALSGESLDERMRMVSDAVAKKFSSSNGYAPSYVYPQAVFDDHVVVREADGRLCSYDYEVEDGVVTIDDEETEVKLITQYVNASSKMKDCIACGGSGNANGNPCEACEGSGEIEVKAAEGHNCSCNGGHSAEESDMKREERIKALSENVKSPVRNVKALGLLSDEEITTLEASLKTAADEKMKCPGCDKMIAKDATKCEDCGWKMKVAAAAAETPVVKTLQEQIAALTPEQLMSLMPADVRALAEAEKTRNENEKTELVTTLKTAQAVYTEDQLKAMELPRLREVAQLVKVSAPPAPDYSGRGLTLVPRTAGAAVDYTPPDPYEAQLKALRAKQA